MTIEKLSEFAKTGDKNTNGLDIERGFPSRLQPARQWHNYLFNLLTIKINQIIDSALDLSKSKINYTDVVDDLISENTDKPLSANMGKKLADDKLDKTALEASGNAPMFPARAWCNFNGSTAAIKGSGNIASISRVSLGVYDVVYTVPMPSANYAIVSSTTARSDAASLNSNPALQTVNGCRLVATYGGDNTVGNYDPIAASFTIFC